MSETNRKVENEMVNPPKVFFETTRLPKDFKYTDYPPTDNFEFFSALDPYYPILAKIFSFLDCHELRKCCLVNKSWKKLAERILSKRSFVTWFTYYPSLNPTLKGSSSLQFRTSNKFWYNNVGCVLILYNTEIMLRYGLSRYKVWQYIKAELIPEGVEHYTINCLGVCSSFNPDIRDAIDRDQPSIVDGIFIPKIPNIKMVMCDPSVDKTDLHIEPDDEVKCLLMFSGLQVMNSLPVLFERLIPEKSASSVAVGGGIGIGRNIFQQGNYDCLVPNIKTFCIAFVKRRNIDADFDAYSLLIPDNCLSQSEFEEKLLQFKQKITVREQAFGVKICSDDLSGIPEASVVFHKLFPGIPLLGIISWQGFGWNCFGSNETNDANSKKLETNFYMDLLQQERSTVFVLITWGPVRSV